MIISIGTFTQEAKRETNRDGARPIDLIDGNELAEKLKELQLGIQVKPVSWYYFELDIKFFSFYVYSMARASTEDKIPANILEGIAKEVRQKALRGKTKVAIMENGKIVLIDPKTNTREVVSTKK